MVERRGAVRDGLRLAALGARRQQAAAAAHLPRALRPARARLLGRRQAAQEHLQHQPQGTRHLQADPQVQLLPPLRRQQVVPLPRHRLYEPDTQVEQ